MLRRAILGRHPVASVLVAVLILTSAWGGRVWGTQASASDAELVQDVTPLAAAPAALPAIPAKPTLSADRAWGMIEADLACSPWLSDADEFSAWVDTAGNRCQVVTDAVAQRLRELDAMLNEHWIGRRATKLLLAGLGVTAVALPEAGIGLTAGVFAVVVKQSPVWTEALAGRAEDLGGWIETATEHWERYARAYAQASADPTAAHIDEWAEASQALLPYLERGEAVVAALNTYATTVDGHITDLQAYLDSVDHWAVAWLADELNARVVGTVDGWLDELRPVLLKTQGRLMVDQALIATMPTRFERFEIVDE